MAKRTKDRIGRPQGSLCRMKHKTESGPAYSILHSTTPKTYMSLASQPQWCRNVAAEVDGRDRYHPRFLSHHQTVYFVSPREPRTRHLITKPRPMCCLHQKVKFWTKRECMSQLGPTLLSWLALLICCGGRIRLRDVRRLLLRKVSRCWSRIECLCQGVSLQRLFILEEFGAMGRSNGVSAVAL